jgi:hypothetical protein
LPDLLASDDYCIAELRLRKKCRLAYPGACSLEFQSLMQILIETLFKWDVKNQKSKGVGIFGTVIAYAPADEEQGRKTLHRHWQVWVKELDMKLRQDLFHSDAMTRRCARARLQKYVDQIMSTTFGPDLILSKEKEMVSNCVDTPFQNFRDARHKDLSTTIEGKVIEIKPESQLIAPSTIVYHSLQRWRDSAFKDRCMQSRQDVFLPLSNARIDMAAYTYSYHMTHETNFISDNFWGDKQVRDLLLRLCFDQHEYNHRHSCFKKSCECRFMFPFQTCSCTYIHEDKGTNNENVIAWHRIDGTTMKMAPWMIVHKRPMGCQWMNVHNKTLSEVFNCNTNVQVGDPFHMFYITLYNLKSTQEEDGQRAKRIAQSLVRRLIRLQDEVKAEKRLANDPENAFVEGLCRMLGGMNAATSRYVVSATMGHLLICQKGTRFMFSHEFSDLLIGQLEAALEGSPVDFRLRVNKHKNRRIAWRDVLAHDYIHRPIDPMFENMCAYEMSMKYQKKYLSFQQMAELESICNGQPTNDDDNDSEDAQYLRMMAEKFTGTIDPFKQTHPGARFSHLAELVHEVIPKISLPGNGTLCDVELLHLNNSKVDDYTTTLRESFWKMYKNQLDIYKSKDLQAKCTFWVEGFRILQNMQDRITLQKHLCRARDPIVLQTKCRQPEKKNTLPNEDRESTMPDITDFLDVYE